MNERGNVIIIPDENQILTREYKKEIFQNYLEAFIAFADKFKLGYHFSNDDYQYAPEKLAHDGHLIIKEIKDTQSVVMFIPELVTDRQLEWYEFHKYDYLDYKLIGAFSIISDSDPEQIYGMSEITKEIKRKNILYNQRDIKSYKI